MSLEQHKRTKEGRFRKERSDSLMENLKKEYPILNKLHGNIKSLGGAEKSLKVDSLSKVIKIVSKIK
jgi:hypothetical protein